MCAGHRKRSVDPGVILGTVTSVKTQEFGDPATYVTSHESRFPPIR